MTDERDQADNTFFGDVVDPQVIDLSGPEFQDYDGPPPVNVIGEYDFSALLSETGLRALAAIVAAFLLVRVPDGSPELFGLALGIMLVAWSVGGVLDYVRGVKKDIWMVAKIVVLVGLSIALFVFDHFSIEELGRLIGVGLIAAGLYGAWQAYRERVLIKPTERVLGILFYLGIGAALLISPQTLLSLTLLALAIYWFFAGVLSLATNLRAGEDPVPPSQTWTEFMKWVSVRPNTADDRLHLYDKVFFEKEEGPRRLSRFFTLMGFATAIATFGVIADSTAVVIGAMLVAPLMTPLMGTSLALVMGWPRRVAYTGAVALAGVLFSIGLAMLFGWMTNIDISPTLNSQVSSRVTPSLVDLMIAMAAGGAGAFALSRPDVSDSLPGVAVAIALVPPLAVVGLMTAQASWTEAVGALLLFVTNMIAILIVGGVVFVLTGVVPLFQIANHSNRIRKTLALIALFGVLVVAVLGFSTDQFQAQTRGVALVTQETDNYIEGTALTRLQVNLTSSQATVTLSGPEEPDDVERLISNIQDALGEDIIVVVNWFPRFTFSN